MAGNSSINDSSQATLDANYARGVMAGVAAMKPQFKAEVRIILLFISEKHYKIIYFKFKYLFCLMK